MNVSMQEQLDHFYCALINVETLQLRPALTYHVLKLCQHVGDGLLELYVLMPLQ